MNDNEQIQYNETLSDFSSLIQEYGAKEVAADFYVYFPQQCQAFVREVVDIKRGKRIAALLKP